MKASDTITKIKTLLGMELSENKAAEVEVKAEEVVLATMNLENGTVLESEEFTKGNEVFIVTEDERVPVPIGEYQLEDGRMLVVTEEGIIDSLTEANEEEAKEEVEAENEELGNEYPTKEEFDALVKRIDELTLSLSESKAKHEEEVTELETQLSELPAAKPITHSPEAKAKEVEFQFSSNRAETSLDRIMKKLS